MIPEIDAAAFDSEVTNSALPTLVFFFVRWGIDVFFLPRFDEVAAERAGSLKFVKCDLDKCPELARRFTIKTSPIVAYFRNGMLARQRHGGFRKGEMLAWIDGIVEREARFIWKAGDFRILSYSPEPPLIDAPEEDDVDAG